MTELDPKALEAGQKLIAEAITEQFGERCSDFEPGCFCCQAWAAFDAILSLSSLLTYEDGLEAAAKVAEEIPIVSSPTEWTTRESIRASAVTAIRALKGGRNAG